MTDARDDESFLAHVADIQRREAPERRRQWIRRVLGCADLSAAQRNVLLALETFADYLDGSNAHPGETNLAEICGLTTRAVRTALSRGCELGLIKKTANENPRASRAAVYRLVLSGEPITGTAVPVKEPITGTAVPVNNSITGTATTPSPERPFRPPSHVPITQGCYVTRVRHQSRASPRTHTLSLPRGSVMSTRWEPGATAAIAQTRELPSTPGKPTKPSAMSKSPKPTPGADTSSASTARGATAPTSATSGTTSWRNATTRARHRPVEPSRWYHHCRAGLKTSERRNERPFRPHRGRRAHHIRAWPW